MPIFGLKYDAQMEGKKYIYAWTQVGFTLRAPLKTH
jgi:hypothetical protein